MITPNPSQPRQAISEEQLEELAASIRTSGVLQPVLVRPHRGAYQLIAGERRWRAAQKAGLERVPAIVREVADGKLLEVALIENIQRQELNPIEEARAYQALQKEAGATQSEVADRVGKQRSTVANTVRLLKLPPGVQAQVERGVLTMGHARALLGLLDASAQEPTAQIIVNKGLNVRQAEELVRRQNEPPRPPGPPPRRDPNVVAAEQGLSRQLGTKVRIVGGMKGKGRLVIEFYSAEELDRIYERLMAH
jgi:ParB family chromosome partitioning protein